MTNGHCSINAHYKTIMMKRLIFYILLGLTSIHASAHTGVGITQDYDNVRVHSYRETNREDYRKAFIIGQLASKLAKELHYTDPIFLDCWLGLLPIDSVASTDYQISVQHHKYWNEEGDGSEKLIIRQQAKNYDVIETLKLVEYAIKNKKSIQKQQQLLKSTFFYDRGNEKLSISNDLIQKALQQPHGEEIEVLLQTRIERPLLYDERKPNFTYYWQNNEYFIFRNQWNRQENDLDVSVLLTLPHIHHFEDLGLLFLVFDTPASFYYLNVNHYDKETRLNKVSARHVIENIGKMDLGFKAQSITHGDVSICINEGMLRRTGDPMRLMLYFYETDTLVQDAYAALEINAANTHQYIL